MKVGVVGAGHRWAGHKPQSARVADVVGFDPAVNQSIPQQLWPSVTSR